MTMSNFQSEPWSTRSSLWANRASKSNSKSLILSGHGASLRIEGSSLLVKNGFTHYPQKQEISRFFPGGSDNPERIILLDCSGSLTFDVLSWLSQQGIDLVQIDWRGEVICLASKVGYSANPFRVEWQRQTRADENARMEYSVGQITKKVENSIITLEKSVRKSPAWNKAMEAAYSTLTKLDARKPQNIMQLRVVEANAAAAYFRAWRGTPIRWRGTSRRPIPDTWREIGVRTSPFLRAGNRNAGNPVNAILNYAYTALQSEIQIRTVSEGYDPRLGIMHEASQGASAFIFDEMEPFRPKVDRKVLEFIKDRVFDPADFILRADGVVRLNPEMARFTVGLSGLS
jgi:CRISPR-associated protein Cas1